MLEEGFAKIFRGADRDTELIIAEDVAKRAKKNLWKNYDEQAEQEKRKKRQQADTEAKPSTPEYKDVIITEIVDGNNFYIQVVGPDAEKLEELMKNLATLGDSSEPFTPSTKGDQLVRAQFTADDAWYRARIVADASANEGEFRVVYIDYGNVSEVEC